MTEKIINNIKLPNGEVCKIGGGGLEIGDIGVAPLGIDETQGKRRYLNGQLIIQEQYVQFTNKVKSAIALYPTLACTEDEWQTAATMTVGGQVGKFVVDDEAGTIRLPKIIMPIQGLTDLSKLGEIVKAGLPTHTHTRGNMNITGTLGDALHNSAWGSGAFADISYSGASYGAGSNSYAYKNLNFYASNSWTGSTSTGNYSKALATTNTVQQEQIQYPYFIQVATGAETKDEITNTIELNNPYSFGDSKYSQIILNNISWLRSLGQWNQKIDYTDYYDWILTNANNGEELFKLSTEEYDDYCWVVNTAEETFRLPIKVKLASGKAVVGNGNGLMFGTGSELQLYTEASNPTVKLYNNIANVPSGSATNPLKLTPDPTKSGIETSDNDLYLYFYVGETVQNANLINAGRIEEKLVDKVDVNSSWSFPSNKYIELTLGASGTVYTAPANGWFVSRQQYNSGYYEVSVGHIDLVETNTSNTQLSFLIPVKKGWKLTYSYSNLQNGTTFSYFRFIYAEGGV